jgi:hypothetical protein
MLLCSHATAALPDPQYTHNTHKHTHTHFYTAWNERAVPQDSLAGSLLSK